MSNPFEKIKEKNAQFPQIRKQAEARYDELVMSVLRELRNALYPHSPTVSSPVSGLLGVGGDVEVFSGWHICGYFPQHPDPSKPWENPPRGVNTGVSVSLIFDSNNCPTSFLCTISQDWFYEPSKSGRTRGLTRHELTEVLARMHS
ncbi:MAG: hypothetical protein G01um101417_42 [Parcubacteria group bacterium Gr01-1014_17]|nr:MAG: hypothetical protein G01um101417_42 [Parcubacteria group bacterium Gr01-1014_17]